MPAVPAGAHASGSEQNVIQRNRWTDGCWQAPDALINKRMRPRAIPINISPEILPNGGLCAAALGARTAALAWLQGHQFVPGRTGVVLPATVAGASGKSGARQRPVTGAPAGLICLTLADNAVAFGVWDCYSPSFDKVSNSLDSGDGLWLHGA